MRKLVPVLFGIGGFLLVAGLVAWLWAPGMVKKTPTDVNSTTRLDGQAGKIDPKTGQLATGPVNVTSVTKADANASDGAVVAWTNSTCVVKAEGNPPDCVADTDDRLVNASTDVFATSRTTGLAVNSSKYLPDDAVPHHGLVNKWPFDAQKKTYPYWDGTAGKAVDAAYQRTVSVKGLETYLYKVAMSDVPIEIADGVQGTYDDVKEIYVEPKTGAILDQAETQQRFLKNGTQAFDLKVSFTDDQVKSSVQDAEDNIGSLNLITRTIPLVGIVGGIVCMLAGAVLMLVTRRNARAGT